VSLEIFDRAGLLPEGLGEDPLSLEQAEIEVKYEGYIKRQEVQAARLARLEDEPLPPALEYGEIPGLRREVLEQLERARPRTLGQASRISGVTPAAIAVLQVYLRARHGRNEELA
jgi:tRNA uridine 5-carboxymethylaminomethyl modification enzyme